MEAIIHANYREWLLDALTQRKLVNPAFSLRAFARYLKLNPTTLSLVLQGKRSLSEHSIQSITQSLGLDPEQARYFRASVLATDGKSATVKKHYTRELNGMRARTKKGNSVDLSVNHFRAIADWYHLAILELLDTTPYQKVPAKKTVTWISETLGVSAEEIEQALTRLMTLGLVITEQGKPVRTDTVLNAGDSVPSSAIRSHHDQYLEKARIALINDPMETRYFSGIVVPTDPKRLPAARKAIQEFREKMLALLPGENQQDVYRMSIQLFKLNRSNKSHKKERKL